MSAYAEQCAGSDPATLCTH